MPADRTPSDVLALTDALREKSVAEPVKQADFADEKSAQDRLEIGRRLREFVQNFPSNEQGLDTFRHHLNELNKEHQLDEAHWNVLLLCMANDDAAASDHDRLIKQVRNEIEDFADGPWCDLST